jgi:uncharacterized protein (DUF2141 family)
MKILSVMLVLFGLCNVLFAQSQLEVIVTAIKNDRGTVRVGIFKDESTFLEKAAYGQVVKAQPGEVKVIFDLPAGIYAISVIHDENENGGLDSGVFGIPKEGFGFGNDTMGSFGPPSFKKASIAVEKEKMSTTIRMRYL